MIADGAIYYGDIESSSDLPAGFAGPYRPGEWVSLHWDCVCDRLTPAQLRALRRLTIRHMRIARLRG